jgi:hypothetical protein
MKRYSAQGNKEWIDMNVSNNKHFPCTLALSYNTVNIKTVGGNAIFGRNHFFEFWETDKQWFLL